MWRTDRGTDYLWEAEEIEEVTTDPRMTCPKCGNLLDEGDWCAKCSSDRQILIGLLVAGLLPILGLGGCVVALAGARYGNYNFWVTVGMVANFLVCSGPVLGIIFFVLKMGRWEEGNEY